MPAVSQAQQNFFKLVNAYKKGGLKKSEVSKDVIATAKEMSKSAISDYLKLKKNAPEKIDNNRSLDEYLPNIDNTDNVYEDITIEDIIKFKTILDMLSNSEDNMPTRGYKYIRM